MPNFKPYDYNQSSMVVINYEDQLQPGTFEHAIHYLVDNRLDLSPFYPKYSNDTGGRSAYDPAILLKIILFAYAKGITSSREIEWSCNTNIIFKALSCDTAPHFTTIANFVSSYPKTMEALFEQILLICHEEGLVGNELFAIDGCKMPSDASKEWSGTTRELEQKQKKIKRQVRYCIKEHKKLDRRRSDEKERAKRLEKMIGTLDKASEKIDKFLKTTGPRMGQGKRLKEVKSNITDNESAKMTTSKGTIQGFNGIAAVDKKHQIVVEAQAFGEGQEHHTLKPMLEGLSDRYRRIGISDDIYQTEVIVTADTGFSNETNNRYLKEQNINAYIPDNDFRSRDPKFKAQKSKYGKRGQGKPKIRNVIPASEFTFYKIERVCVCPAGEVLTFNGDRTTDTGLTKAFFSGRLSQCKQCDLKYRCMQNPESAEHRNGSGRQVSFQVKKKRTATDWMKRRVDSKMGKQIYSHRMSVVEPVFGNIGTNKRLNRFGLRGKEKVNGQWKLYCMIQNIEKLMRYGNMVPN